LVFCVTSPKIKHTLYNIIDFVETV